jgi:hypothetical protein
MLVRRTWTAWRLHPLDLPHHPLASKMSIGTLLNVPQHPAGKNVFAFEHAMAHREVMAVMGPLTQWSVVPYFIDPFQFDAQPGTNWHLNHQRSHDDFVAGLPPDFLAENPGMTTNQPVLDNYLPQQDNRSWWTFINHQEHYTANQTVLPLPFFLEGTHGGLPWWMTEGRFVRTYW